MNITRRHALLGLLALLSSVFTAGCAGGPDAKTAPQTIVFVHGDGDSAALWQTTMWRFESNGWPRDRLFAIDMPYPQSRDEDAKPQEGRSSTDEHMRFLAAEVDRMRRLSGADKVVLIGNSRGGNAIRNYIANGGGDKTVSHAVLGGTPNHGVWAFTAFRPTSEFNGTGPFLTALNAPKGADGNEVTPGVKWLTLRSDNNDKYAQPDGAYIGAKGQATNVSFDGPALRGATNVVLPARDHREVSFHPEAFAQTYTFLTGQAPATKAIVPEAQIVLDGKVSGRTPAGAPTNLALEGAVVEVYAVEAASGARRGAAPLLRKTIGADGRWGPLKADSGSTYEFVIAAPGYAITHIYRSPFPRSSDIVQLRAERLAEADKSAQSVIVLTRPRGYFGVPRDTVTLDGVSPPVGIPPGVAGVSSAKLKLADGAGRAVAAEFVSGDLRERIVGRAWPAAENHAVFLELTN